MVRQAHHERFFELPLILFNMKAMNSVTAVINITGREDSRYGIHRIGRTQKYTWARAEGRSALVRRGRHGGGISNDAA